jgi:hypothetical protein
LFSTTICHWNACPYCSGGAATIAVLLVTARSAFARTAVGSDASLLPGFESVSFELTSTTV